MAIDAGTISTKLRLDMSDFNKNLSKAQKQGEKLKETFEGTNKKLKKDTEDTNDSLKKTGKTGQDLAKSMHNVGDSMSKVGNKLTLGVTLPLGIIAKKGIEAGANFEAGMSQVAAISNASGKDLEALTAKAQEMGRTTKFSATESSEALKYMAMAGWKTNDMLDGLDGVMNLAAASGEELGLVSDIVTDALSAFGMEAKQAGEFADLLASASSNSNTNVAMMGETFKYAAPVAGALGYTAEDTALAIGLMANAGIKGSQAGTALRGMMTRLAKPTKESGEAMKELGIKITDNNGKIKPFNQLLGEMRTSFSKLTPEQKAQYAASIAGQQGMSGLLAIMNASEGDFNKLTKATREYTGEAKRMSDQMEDNLQGELTKLKSQLEGLAIDGFKMLVPHLRNMVSHLQKTADWFGRLTKEQQGTILKMGGLAFAAGPVMKGLGGILKVTSKLPGASTLAGKTLGGLTGALGKAGGSSVGAMLDLKGFGGVVKAFPAIANPTTLAIAGIGTAAVLAAKKMNERALPEVELFGEGISKGTEKAITEFMDKTEKFNKEFDYALMTTKEITDEKGQEIYASFKEHNEQMLEDFRQTKEARLQETEEMLNSITGMTQEEKDKILEIERSKFEKKEELAEDGMERVKAILEAASEENRGLTEFEKKEITRIRREMRDVGILTYSETQQEAEKILTNLKENATTLSVEQASNVIKQSIKQRDKTIENANKEYNERIAYAKTLRQEGSKEAIELANKIEEQAKIQRDSAVAEAEGMHTDVVNEIRKQGSDIISQLDTDNGEIKSNWDRLRSWFNNNPIVRRIRTASQESMDMHDAAYNPSKNRTTGKTRGNTSGQTRRFARGTLSAPGGWAIVGEKGRELVKLPKGTEVKTNEQTEKIFQRIQSGQEVEGKAKRVAVDLAPSFLDKKTYKRKFNVFTNNNSSNSDTFISNNKESLRDRARGAIKETFVSKNNLINNTKNNIVARDKDKKASSNIIQHINNTPHFARGTLSAPGGWAVVGEKGRELVKLPKGAQVKTNQETEKMLGGQNIVNNWTVHATVREEADIKKISRELDRIQKQKIRGQGGVLLWT